MNEDTMTNASLCVPSVDLYWCNKLFYFFIFSLLNSFADVVAAKIFVSNFEHDSDSNSKFFLMKLMPPIKVRKQEWMALHETQHCYCWVGSPLQLSQSSLLLMTLINYYRQNEFTKPILKHAMHRHYNRLKFKRAIYKKNSLKKMED